MHTRTQRRGWVGGGCLPAAAGNLLGFHRTWRLPGYGKRLTFARAKAGAKRGWNPSVQVRRRREHARFSWMSSAQISQSAAESCVHPRGRTSEKGSHPNNDQVSLPPPPTPRPFHYLLNAKLVTDKMDIRFFSLFFVRVPSSYGTKSKHNPVKA